MQEEDFKELLLRVIGNSENPFHPLVWINGHPTIGDRTYIGGFSEINAKGAKVTIGSGCDISSFVAINVADSHKRCLGLTSSIDCKDIWLGDSVFVGTHSAILGGSKIGHNSVIAAGTIVRGIIVPPYSLVIGDQVKAGYYA